jgi:hypothetical protein
MCRGPSSTPDRFQSETEFTMNTYVAIIGGKAVLTFRAVDDDQAHAKIDDQEGSMRSDLKVKWWGSESKKFFVVSALRLEVPKWRWSWDKRAC